MSRPLRSARILPAIVLIVGLALSIGGYYQGSQYVNHTHRARLAREVVTVVERLTLTLRVYQDLLRPMTAFLADQPMTGERWAEFLHKFEWRTTVPHWMDIGWVSIEPGAGAASPPHRFVLRWVESRDKDSRFAAGMDLAKVPSFSAVEAQARNSRLGMASEPFNIHREDLTGKPGNLLLHPVRGPSLDGAEELRGYLLLTYDPLATLDWSLQPSVQRAVEARLLPRGARSMESLFDLKFPIVGSTFFGTTNHYLIVPTQSFYDPSLVYFPGIVLVGGGTCTLLLAAILWTQIRRRVEAERISVEIRQQAESLRVSEETVRELNQALERRVSERTIELVGSNRQLQSEISARMRAENDLLRALATEKELNQLKSNFVAIVSHEFRTPLANIRS
ncbi:MAG TPA: hypothetical protein VMF06_09730, partial [Candidatus Limnocylindria bacterium]|nr:hypothetical protein [Candidatus Limnocylindria bacterium]